VRGKFGDALKFNGENSVTIEKVANFKRSDPFSFSFWLNIPEERDEIVVMHHQQAGADAGYNGYQFILEHGHASFGLIHFWPGNALKVRTREKFPLNEWVHVILTYDGSSRAAGVKIFRDGKEAELEVQRDSLYKDFANNQPLTIAARFRGRGFKDGMIDELKIFNRCLVADVDPELKKLRDEENALVNTVREIMVMGDAPKPRPTYLLKRGAYDAHGDEVQPGTPDAIMPMDSNLPRNRLGLARWLVDPMNPLTARVIVNRYWQMFFGRGLVVTAEDFGSQGQLPSHPELLDWLAKHFMDSKWDLKALAKMIVMSATYRQSSRASPELLARDPDNILLARGAKNRLTAEMLRDSALAASGLLVRKIGGPSVKPYQPEGLWEEKSSGWKYETDKGNGLYRRSMYTYWKRASQHPTMITFDAAERNTCIVRRQTTSTPLQALVLMNDTQFVEAARKLAERTIKEGGAHPRDRIQYMFRSLTSRPPTERELAVLQHLIDEQQSLFDSQRAEALAKIGESALESDAPSHELAAYTMLANAIMNFDEVVIKR